MQEARRFDVLYIEDELNLNVNDNAAVVCACDLATQGSFAISGEPSGNQDPPHICCAQLYKANSVQGVQEAAQGSVQAGSSVQGLPL